MTTYLTEDGTLYLQKQSPLSGNNNNNNNNPHITQSNSKYKVILKLSQAEIQTIRSSWSQMLSGAMQNSSDDDDDDDDYDSENEEERENNAFFSSIPGNQRGSFSSLFCHQFYTNLLGLDPTLESFFPSIKHQAASFAGVLQMAILHLEDLSALDDFLDSLGKRHSRVLGIEAPQFDLMGAALIKTFADRFGRKFTPLIEDVWVKLYSYLANTILENGTEDVLNIDADPFFEFQSLPTLPVSSTSASIASSSSVSSELDSASIASSKTSANEHNDMPEIIHNGKSIGSQDIYSNSVSINNTTETSSVQSASNLVGNLLSRSSRNASRFTSRKSSNKNLKNNNINVSLANSASYNSGLGSPSSASNNNNSTMSPSSLVFADLVVPGVTTSHNPSSYSGISSSSSPSSSATSGKSSASTARIASSSSDSQQAQLQPQSKMFNKTSNTGITPASAVANSARASSTLKRLNNAQNAAQTASAASAAITGLNKDEQPKSKFANFKNVMKFDKGNVGKRISTIY